MNTQNLILESLLFFGIAIANIALVKFILLRKFNFKNNENIGIGWFLIAIFASSTLILSSSFQAIKDVILNLVVYSNLTQSMILLKILSVISIYFLVSFILFATSYYLSKFSTSQITDVKKSDEIFSSEFRLLVFIGFLISFTIVSKEIFQFIISNSTVNEFRIN